MSMSLSSTEGMVPGLDYSNVEGLQRKRLLAFVNHFLVRTVESLTVFSRTCDTKLSSIQGRLKKLENALLLLEAKLDSVPILQEQRIEGLKLTSENSIVDVKKDFTVSTTAPATKANVKNDEPEASSSNRPQRRRDDPIYERFFKMIAVGIPDQAVRLKMQMQGLDDSVLDEPKD